jgi:endonuclease
MRRFNVVITRDDGGVEVYPMKAWLRLHPEHVPSGMDPTTSTSHELRNGLRKAGWRSDDLPTEVRLFPPGPSARAVVDDVLGGGDEDAGADHGIAFALENQLRDFLAHNLRSVPVGGQRLRLYVDPSGRDGVEYPTAVGPIDILAQAEDGAFFVFELKVARGPDRALGQLARYMGWVKSTLAISLPVHGVIVARTIDEKLRYAASVVPAVTLLEYEIDFRVRPAAL